MESCKANSSTGTAHKLFSRGNSLQGSNCLEELYGFGHFKWEDLPMVKLSLTVGKFPLMWSQISWRCLKKDQKLN